MGLHVPLTREHLLSAYSAIKRRSAPVTADPLNSSLIYTVLLWGGLRIICSLFSVGNFTFFFFFRLWFVFSKIVFSRYYSDVLSVDS